MHIPVQVMSLDSLPDVTSQHRPQSRERRKSSSDSQKEKKIGSGKGKSSKSKAREERDVDEKKKTDDEEEESSEEEPWEDDENDDDYEPNDPDTLYCICRKPYNNRSVLLLTNKCSVAFLFVLV